jgi:hypothetical protein
MAGTGHAAIAWQRVDAVGLERFGLVRDTAAWTLRGTLLIVDQGVPYEAGYEVTCDDKWVTRAVLVDVRGPEGNRSLRLTAGDGRWRHENGAQIDAIRGCVDVDLAWSPSTNTLPIRRLGLGVGQAAAAVAAWIRFPQLTVEPLAQEYLRLTERRYRYSSAGGRFVAELDVDDDGLVTRYGDIWARVPGP